jgi:hypothetical protein
LFALEASARFATKGKPPVTSITIANPRVGDVHFRKAIRLLEQQKRLRCLTVHNEYDLVPNVPNRLCRADFCRPNNFRQPGMELVLAKSSFRTNYQGDTKWGEEFKQEFRRFMILVFCFVRMAEQVRPNAKIAALLKCECTNSLFCGSTAQLSNIFGSTDRSKGRIEQVALERFVQGNRHQLRRMTLAVRINKTTRGDAGSFLQRKRTSDLRVPNKQVPNQRLPRIQHISKAYYKFS